MFRFHVSLLPLTRDFLLFPYRYLAAKVFKLASRIADLGSGSSNSVVDQIRVAMYGTTGPKMFLNYLYTSM
jgi:hypothetical protein